MAEQINPNHATEQNVRAIAEKIHQAAIAIAGSHGAMMDATEEVQKQSKEVANKRLEACSTVAGFSLHYQWDEVLLDQAVKLAAAMPFSNNAQTSKAIAVLCSQIKLCALPAVRAKFPTIRKVIEDAWEAEQADIEAAKLAKEDPPKAPLRKFVSRKYELILRACREIKEGKTGLVLQSIADVVAWADRNDPDIDADRTAKQLKQLATTLHELFQRFPLAEIDEAKQAIASVKAHELTAARNAMLAAEEAKRQALPLAPIPPTVQARLNPTPEPAPEPANDILEGAYDPTDDILNDAANPSPSTPVPTVTQLAA